MPKVMSSVFAILLSATLINVGALNGLAPIRADEPSLSDMRKHPLSDAERAELKQTWDDKVTELTKKLATKTDDLSALSQRGDAHFFRGNFPASLRDYQKMCEVNPEAESSHWRMGLVQFYAGEFETSTKFFDRFFKTDDVDREGGLWKYLAQAKGEGPEQAKAGLLKYTKFDREPMPTVYRLFEGTLTPEELLKTVNEKKLGETEREKRLFYIELYIGLWLDAHKQPQAAQPHFRAATANKWPRDAGYGPNWMWHVARVHYELLAK